MSLSVLFSLTAGLMLLFVAVLLVVLRCLSTGAGHRGAEDERPAEQDVSELLLAALLQA